MKPLPWFSVKETAQHKRLGLVQLVSELPLVNDNKHNAI